MIVLGTRHHYLPTYILICNAKIQQIIEDCKDKFSRLPSTSIFEVILNHLCYYGSTNNGKKPKPIGTRRKLTIIGKTAAAAGSKERTPDDRAGYFT